jgi:hypothetical protein
MKRKGYTRTPNGIITETSLSVAARLMYIYILSQPATWTFSPPAIAKAMGMGVDWVKSTLSELEVKGWLRRERQRGDNGRLQGSRYTLTKVGETNVGATNVGATNVGESTPIRMNNIKKTNLKKTECEPPAASGGTHTSLDLFRMNLTKAAEGKRVPAAILRKFEAYWTQDTKDGKQLWQVTRPFDFGKRLKKWIEDERAI